MIKYDSEKTYNLEEFANIQYEQINQTLDSLLAIKKEVMDVSYNACIVK